MKRKSDDAFKKPKLPEKISNKKKYKSERKKETMTRKEVFERFNEEMLPKLDEQFETISKEFEPMCREQGLNDDEMKEVFEKVKLECRLRSINKFKEIIDKIGHEKVKKIKSPDEQQKKLNFGH